MATRFRERDSRGESSVFWSTILLLMFLALCLYIAAVVAPASPQKNGNQEPKNQGAPAAVIYAMPRAA